MGNVSKNLDRHLLEQYIDNMNGDGSIEFEWDPNKARSNESKHGVTFEEATTAFYDAYARVIADPDHSDEEERFVIIGFSRKVKVLTVCHCHRGAEDRIRIISARKATKNEENQYWRFVR